MRYLTFVEVNERYEAGVRRMLTGRTCRRDGKGNTGTNGIRKSKNGVETTVSTYTEKKDWGKD